MRTKTASNGRMKKGLPVPTRFDEAEEDFLSEIKQRTGFKKAEIVRRACRFSLPKFLSGEVNILDMVPGVSVLPARSRRNSHA
jgi:hypothetical protein